MGSGHPGRRAGEDHHVADSAGGCMTIYDTRVYYVSELRSLLRRWQEDDSRDHFRSRIVDAIQGHSEGDLVRVRLDSPLWVRVFELAAGNGIEWRVPA